MATTNISALSETERDSAIEDLLARLRANFGDEVAREALTARLDGTAPTPVRLHHLPNWLRLAWVRATPDRSSRYRILSGWAVAMEIGEWLDRLGDSLGLLDHWGSTLVAGRRCFVNEPYADPVRAADLFRELARKVGALDAFTRSSHWGSGTVRVLLFPPDEPTVHRRRESR